MKVTIEKDYKNYYTMADIVRARAIISSEKEDEETTIGWAEFATKEALKDTDDYLVKVINADAYTAKNSRIWNAYGNDSGDMDVWIEALARTSNGYIEIGAYLSDIWQTGDTPYKHHMYIVRYTKKGENE